MQSRAEVATRYAKAYVRASKKDKGRVLDEVVSVTGWSRPRSGDHPELVGSARSSRGSSGRRSTPTTR